MRDSDRPLDPKDEKKLKTRGLGTGREYEPFIKVHEISSTGESFRILGRNTTRPHHLLSRLELSAFLVFDRYKTTVDIREQYPLPLIDTLSICARLGIKHPQMSGKLKIVTTDLLIDLKNASGVAVAVKYADEFEDQRVIEKLQIEKCSGSSKVSNGDYLQKKKSLHLLKKTLNGYMRQIKIRTNFTKNCLK
jgi:hypothetical protein